MWAPFRWRRKAEHQAAESSFHLLPSTWPTCLQLTGCPDMKMFLYKHSIQSRFEQLNHTAGQPCLFVFGFCRSLQGFWFRVMYMPARMHEEEPVAQPLTLMAKDPPHKQDVHGHHKMVCMSNGKIGGKAQLHALLSFPCVKKTNNITCVGKHEDLRETEWWCLPDFLNNWLLQ